MSYVHCDMSYVHCDCGLAKHQSSGFGVCEHCDQPCDKRGCDQCETYSRAVTARAYGR